MQANISRFVRRDQLKQMRVRSYVSRLRRGAINWLCPANKMSGVVLLILALTLVMVPDETKACGGSGQPVCGRATVLAKAAPIVVVAVPASPVVVMIPVTVVISTTGTCRVPTMTTIALAGVCFPPPAGAGMITIPTPTPGTYFALVPVTFPAGPPRVCLVGGTATTTWADGVMTVGFGDTLVCLVEPAPDNPNIPRLDLVLLTTPIQIAHPGDQRTHSYLLTNNDPNESVTVTIEADSEQVARLSTMIPPPAPGSGEGPYAISDPGDGDNFPIAFAEGLSVPVGPDNYIIDDGSRETGVGLNADGSIIWLNQFNVLSGQSIIDRISVAYGNGANGIPASVLIWDDPNNDGNPDDAVLLNIVDTVGANAGNDIFNEVLIPPTNVGEPGDSFFVGVVMQDLLTDVFVVAVDTDSDQVQSWIAADMTCQADVENLSNNETPPILSGDAGFAGNFMIRAHGSDDLINWLELPPDPTAFGIPIITKTITLCPNESRLVHIVQRSWPMCPSGACSEQRLIIEGFYDGGDPAFACAGALLLLDTGVPPDFQCPDGGSYCLQIPDGSGLDFLANMPTHEVNQRTDVLNVNVIPQKMPPLQSAPPQSEKLDHDTGRIIVSNISVKGGPATFVDRVFNLFCEVEMPSNIPDIETQLVELSLVGASPVVGDTYFHVFATAQLSGGSIPPELDTFFNSFFRVSVDGITGGEFHRDAIIFQDKINIQILDPTHLGISLTGIFPSEGNAGPPGPPEIDDIVLIVDFKSQATGLDPSAKKEPPCPWDLDNSGSVGTSDLLELFAQWGTDGSADFDGSGAVGTNDLLILFANWGPCP